MATQRALNLPPIWERSHTKTTKVHVFLNGDNKYPGKEININKRQCPNFDIWLDQLTLTIKPRTGAIRRLFTPKAGHRVSSLDRLQNGDKLVAGGYEEFKKCDYDSVTGPKKGGPRISYDVEPGHNKRINVSARFRKQDTKALLIKCWVNGVPSSGLKPISIMPPHGAQMSLKDVLNAVHDKMKDCFSEPPRSCRLYTFEGQPISNLAEVEHCGCYVAAGRKERFKQGDYQERSRPSNFSSSPSPRRTERLPPIRSNKTSSQSSPEHSISSNNGYRREKAKRDEVNGFHFRPVKHNRSSEKTRQADYDQDQGGVFKAKSTPQATRGAKEVKDSRHTKTDLPVDQRPAEEVKEEVKGKDKKDKKKKQLEDENGSPPRRNNPDHGERTYRTNARRPDSPSTNQEARLEAEREAQSQRQAEDQKRLDKTRKKQEDLNKRKEEEAKKKKKEEDRKKKEEEEARKKKEEEEEDRRRLEEVWRLQEEEEERRRRREMEEERIRLLEEEEERRNAALTSNPQEDNRPGQSPYRSGTDILRDEQPRDERQNDDSNNPSPYSPAPGNQTERGLTDSAWDDPKPAEEAKLVEDELAEQERGRREEAATTLQKHYRGFKARQQYAEMRLE